MQRLVLQIFVVRTLGEARIRCMQGFIKLHFYVKVQTSSNPGLTKLRTNGRTTRLIYFYLFHLKKED
jgi:hypothetical protein